MIGTVFASCRFNERIFLVASKPFIFGIMISIRIKSNSFTSLFSNKSITSWPSFAHTTWIPLRSNIYSTISIFKSLSSATSTHKPSNDICWLLLFLFSIGFPNLKGIWIETKVPIPFSLSNWIFPCICSTSFLAIGKPRPVPWYVDLLELSSCANKSKACWIKSWLIPIPLSLHLNSKSDVESSKHFSFIHTWISPFSGVNLTAFCATIDNIRERYIGNPLKLEWLNWPSYQSKTYWIFFSCANCCASIFMFPNNLVISKSTSSSVKWSLSKSFISKTSLTKEIK